MTEPKCNRLAVLVTGSRGWTDENAIDARLRSYHLPLGGHPSRGSVLIHGAADGADNIAESVASTAWWIDATPYFDWLGKAGGHVRNAMMLDKLKLYQKYGYVCSVEAFSLGTPGTEGMIKLATAAGFPVHVTRGAGT